MRLHGAMMVSDAARDRGLLAAVHLDERDAGNRLHSGQPGCFRLTERLPWPLQAGPALRPRRGTPGDDIAGQPPKRAGGESVSGREDADERLYVVIQPGTISIVAWNAPGVGDTKDPRSGRCRRCLRAISCSVRLAPWDTEPPARRAPACLTRCRYPERPRHGELDRPHE